MKNNITHNPKALAAAYITALMLPVLILAYTEKNPLWATIAGILLPLGAYTAFAALSLASSTVRGWCRGGIRTTASWRRVTPRRLS